MADRGINLSVFRRDLFESRFDRTDGCWLWTGHENGSGYGSFDQWLAHRVAYELYIGPIPDGLEVMHLCRTRLCIRPEHLKFGTHQENLDMREPKRSDRW